MAHLRPGRVRVQVLIVVRAIASGRGWRGMLMLGRNGQVREIFPFAGGALQRMPQPGERAGFSERPAVGQDQMQVMLGRRGEVGRKGAVGDM